MYDTIIIGAGMSGLAAGIRLAYYDQSVCILERHTTIGGLNSFYRLGGRNYDVGLHAVTNFTVKGTKRGPLARLLRQLRFRWDDFALVPQIGSKVAFPGIELKFNNDIELLTSEVTRAFPDQTDNFLRLIDGLIDYDQIDDAAGESARAIVGEIITDPLLVDMLLCPLMFYGCARPRDMDYGQFCIMFRSIFLEGFSRPFAGVRVLLKNLVRRYRELGGELRLRAGVRRIVEEDGRAVGVELDDGTLLEGRRIFSSAGWSETMRMCQKSDSMPQRASGELSFTETISVLDRQPADLGHHETIIFFNDSNEFQWEKPDGLVDVRSGVICSPNNFCYEKPLDVGMIRITSLANYDLWAGLPEERYRLEKLAWYDRIVDSAVRFMPDFRRAVTDTDMFTPTTIRRFTGHDNGAVYGAPDKQTDGTTHLKNLYICGTDQGWVGIIGTIISGIMIANRYALREG